MWLPLMTLLADAGHTVLLETSGAHDISAVDPRVHRIMDLKTHPAAASANGISFFEHRAPGEARRSEILCYRIARRLHDWSKTQLEGYRLNECCRAVLFSPIFGRIDSREIVDWILADRLPVRFQLQMHKFIWTPTQRGV